MTPRKAAAAPKYRPRQGAPVMDTVSGFVGLFQAIETTVRPEGVKAVPVAFLRPYGGGQEITTDPSMLRAATPEEILSARVAVENQHSRERLR